MTPGRVAVVGAGIAGLSAAYELRRAGVEVVVFEAADRPGGKLQTRQFVGMDLDEGADSFLARVPWGVQLCRDLGLGEELISPSVGAAQVVHQGRLAPLPEGLLLGVPTDLDALARSGLLSEAGLAAVQADADRAGTTGTSRGVNSDIDVSGDVAVGALVRSRLGDEAFEVLVDPLLSGVNAGQADELSAQLGAAQLLAAARTDPSLIGGARAVAAAGLAAATAAAESTGTAAGSTRPPIFYAIPGGMGRLVAALVEAIGAERVRCGQPVTALQPAPAGYQLTVAGGTITVDAVVLATPAPVSAHLLRPFAGLVAAGLDELRYASVALVGLAYRRDQLPGALDSSGFLVPRRAGLFLTACSWSSSKFAHLGADGIVRLRASVGRSDDTRFATLSDEEIVARIQAELVDLMGIEGDPLAWRVRRWMGSLPQYRPGHTDNVERWETALAQSLPGVVLAGAALRGLGVPACIASGQAAARSLLA